MAENRMPRSTENRNQTQRPQQWAPPELLPEPDKQPGYKYRWIRVTLGGQSDARNISTKIREGWEPVKVEEQPQYSLLVNGEGRWKDCVQVGDVMLCKTPEELAEQRNQHYLQQSEQQIKAVDNNLMRQNDPRMPLFKESNSSTSRGGGT
jgi:hypothetical protein